VGAASAPVIREVAEEAGVAITVTGLTGVYSEDGIYQQFAVCFRAFTPVRDAQPDHPEQTTQLIMHPAMRQRLTDATLLPTVTDIGCSRVNPDTSTRPPHQTPNQGQDPPKTLNPLSWVNDFARHPGLLCGQPTVLSKNVLRVLL
jgi:hypothetical protein